MCVQYVRIALSLSLPLLHLTLSDKLISPRCSWGITVSRVESLVGAHLFSPNPYSYTSPETWDGVGWGGGWLSEEEEEEEGGGGLLQFLLISLTVISTDEAKRVLEHATLPSLL